MTLLPHKTMSLSEKPAIKTRKKSADTDVLPTELPLPAGGMNRRFGTGFLLHDVSRLRRTVFDQRVRPYGITRSQWWVLAHLSRARGRPMSQIELARLLDVGKATLGGLIDRLERSGYVVRGNDTVDRRVKFVNITPEGEKLISIMEKVGDDVNDSVVAGISKGDMQVLERSLAQMKLNLLELLKDREA